MGLEVYTSEGHRFDPTPTELPEEPRVRDMILGGVKLTLNPSQSRVTGFFRATEAPQSRAEQFYALYTDEGIDRPYTAFVNEVRSQLGDWGYEISDDDDSMDIFNAATDRRWNTNFKGNYVVDELHNLVNDHRPVTVGAGSPETALSLSREFGADRTVAITEKPTVEPVEQYDVVIVSGNYNFVEPLNRTAEQIA
jgi:hypothetical protein